MFTLKTILILIVGMVIGGSLSLFFYFENYKEYWVASQVSIDSLRVRDFATLNEASDKRDYCIRYKIATESFNTLKEQLKHLESDASSGILKFEISEAWGAMEEFSKVKPEKLRYECKA